MEIAIAFETYNKTMRKDLGVWRRQHLSTDGSAVSAMTEVASASASMGGSATSARIVEAMASASTDDIKVSAGIAEAGVSGIYQHILKRIRSRCKECKPDLHIYNQHHWNDSKSTCNMGGYCHSATLCHSLGLATLWDWDWEEGVIFKLMIMRTQLTSRAPRSPLIISLCAITPVGHCPLTVAMPGSVQSLVDTIIGLTTEECNELAFQLIEADSATAELLAIELSRLTRFPSESCTVCSPTLSRDIERVSAERGKETRGCLKEVKHFPLPLADSKKHSVEGAAAEDPAMLMDAGSLRVVMIDFDGPINDYDMYSPSTCPSSSELGQGRRCSTVEECKCQALHGRVCDQPENSVDNNLTGWRTVCSNRGLLKLVLDVLAGSSKVRILNGSQKCLTGNSMSLAGQHYWEMYTALDEYFGSERRYLRREDGDFLAGPVEEDLRHSKVALLDRVRQMSESAGIENCNVCLVDDNICYKASAEAEGYRFVHCIRSHGSASKDSEYLFETLRWALNEPDDVIAARILDSEAEHSQQLHELFSAYCKFHNDSVESRRVVVWDFDGPLNDDTCFVDPHHMLNSEQLRNAKCSLLHGTSWEQPAEATDKNMIGWHTICSNLGLVKPVLEVLASSSKVVSLIGSQRTAMHKCGLQSVPGQHYWEMYTALDECFGSERRYLRREDGDFLAGDVQPENLNDSKVALLDRVRQMSESAGIKNCNVCLVDDNICYKASAEAEGYRFVHCIRSHGSASKDSEYLFETLRWALNEPDDVIAARILDSEAEHSQQLHELFSAYCLAKFENKQLLSLQGTGGRWNDTVYQATVDEIREDDDTVKVRYTDGGYKRFRRTDLANLVFVQNTATLVGTAPRLGQPNLRGRTVAWNWISTHIIAMRQGNRCLMPCVCTSQRSNCLKKLQFNSKPTLCERQVSCTCICEGYLHKKGAGTFDGWQTRWFVMTEGVLQWFKDVSSVALEQPKGHIATSAIQKLSFDADENQIRLFTNSEHHGGRIFELEALNAEEFEKWKLLLEAIIKLNHENRITAEAESMAESMLQSGSWRSRLHDGISRCVDTIRR